MLKALLSGDAERFYREEIRMREAAGLPPFGRLAALIVSANDRQASESHARALARAAPATADVMVLGPAEAPIAVVRGRHRFRLLVKTPRDFPCRITCAAGWRRGPRSPANAGAGGRGPDEFPLSAFSSPKVERPERVSSGCAAAIAMLVHARLSGRR